jgi:hypothetical protein
MRSTFRSMIAALFLLTFAVPLCAQNPNVAIHIEPDKACVKGTLKNLRPSTIAVPYVELWIYDAKTCQRICVTRKVINKRIEPCQTMDFDLCCANLPPASGYIYYVRVHHSAGINEEWAFT